MSTIRASKTFAWIPLLAVLAAGPLPASPAPEIENETPAGARRTWSLEESWRVGGEADDHLFGLVIDARSDEQGNVYLLDQALSHVTVVAPDGTYVADLGGEGDGPGECRMPQTFVLMPDGTVGLGQRFPGRFIKVALNGDPAGNVDIGGDAATQAGFTMLVSARYRSGTLLVGTLHQVPAETGQSRNSHLLSLAPTGEILQEFAQASTYLDFGKPHFLEREMAAAFMDAHAVGPDGRVYLADERNSYRIQVWSAAGTLERTITRAFRNPDRPQQTIDRMNALFEEQDRALPFRITWEVEPCDQTIGELTVTADNRLLVSHSRSGLDLPEGVFARYDVFDAAGVWLHELDIRCQADRDQDGLIFLDDGRILLVRGLQLARLTASGNGGAVTDGEDSAEVMEIICCRPVVQEG